MQNFYSVIKLSLFSIYKSSVWHKLITFPDINWISRHLNHIFDLVGVIFQVVVYNLSVVTWYACKLLTAAICLAFLPLKILISLFKFTLPEIFANLEKRIFCKITFKCVSRRYSEAATGGVLLKKGVLRNFAKFTGKLLCQRLFFNKVADPRPAILLKKSVWHRYFVGIAFLRIWWWGI